MNAVDECTCSDTIVAAGRDQQLGTAAVAAARAVVVVAVAAGGKRLALHHLGVE